MTNAVASGYKQAFGGDDHSLEEFLKGMAKLDREFCEAMASGDDYTIRFEIHGCKHQMIHCRVVSDTFRRPRGIEKKVEKRKG